jgi:hypothetical protein
MAGRRSRYRRVRPQNSNRESAPTLWRSQASVQNPQRTALATESSARPQGTAHSSQDRNYQSWPLTERGVTDKVRRGEMTEWPKVPDSKSGVGQPT